MIKKDEITLEHQHILRDIGMQLKMLRKNKKLGYIEAAKYLNIDKKTLYKIERGELNFQVTTLFKLVDFYEVPIEKFLTNCNLHEGGTF